MTAYVRYFADGIIEDKTGLLQPIFQAGTAHPVAANELIVAAVSGKKIRVTKLWLQNGGAAGTILFLDGSGGRFLTTFIDVHAPDGSRSSVQLPFDPTGYCETSTGVGLYAAIQGSAIWVGLQYYLITP